MSWFLALSLPVSFAVLVTTHLIVCAALAKGPPRWRGPLALLVPPLAPFWAYTGGLKKRAIFWGTSLVLYLTCLAIALLNSPPTDTATVREAEEVGVDGVTPAP